MSIMAILTAILPVALKLVEYFLTKQLKDADALKAFYDFRLKLGKAIPALQLKTDYDSIIKQFEEDAKKRRSRGAKK